MILFLTKIHSLPNLTRKHFLNWLASLPHGNDIKKCMRLIVVFLLLTSVPSVRTLIDNALQVFG